MTNTGRMRDRLAAAELERAGAGGRCCAWPGCEAAGLYKAPRSRGQLREYQLLCLEHVREFNQHWNYFAGMKPADIEAHQRADTTWHRPSWRFGTAPGSRWDDVFGLFEEEAFAEQRPRPPQREPTRAERMMAVLDLQDGFTLDELKKRYKILAKQHHPDLHGGDKMAEERLKVINEAYTFLRGQRLYA